MRAFASASGKSNFPELEIDDLFNARTHFNELWILLGLCELLKLLLVVPMLIVRLTVYSFCRIHFNAIRCFNCVINFKCVPFHMGSVFDFIVCIPRPDSSSALSFSVNSSYKEKCQHCMQFAWIFVILNILFTHFGWWLMA